MKTIIKIVIALVVLIVIALAIVFAIVFAQSDNIIKTAIEKGATYATQTTTTVESVDLGIFDGTFAMTGLNINNPEGFNTDHFLKLNSTAVAVDPASFAGNVISIPTVTFDGLDIILDKGQNPSNYNAILASLQRFESTDKPKQDPAAPSGKTVAIDSLILKDINIRLANMPGVSILTGDVAINIPQIELKDIGKNEPMGIPEIVNLVVKTVLTAAIESGGGIIPSDILGELGNGLGALTSLSDMGITAIGGAGEIIGQQMDAVLENAGAALDSVTDQAGDVVDNLTETLPIPEDLSDDLQNTIDDTTEDLKEGLNNLNPFNKKKDP